MEDFSSLTRGQTFTPCIGGEVLTPGLPGQSLAFIINQLVSQSVQSLSQVQLFVTP